jgi:menaquinone-dependent protoporphyrinogen oxidase
MTILVAYASRHGATRGIAEGIARTLERSGLEVTLRAVEESGSVDEYDAFIIGSAAYINHWLKEATRFVQRHRSLLASRPVWLFSSGPVGTETVDAQGREVLQASEPREFAEFAAEIHPRDQRVFFGAYDPDAEPVGLMERLGAVFTRMPAIRAALPAGDFRDWPEIEAWSEGIARERSRLPGPLRREASHESRLTVDPVSLGNWAVLPDDLVTTASAARSMTDGCGLTRSRA